MSAPRRSTPIKILGDKETVIDLFNARLDDRIEKRQSEKELVQIIQRKNTEIQILNQVNTRLGAQLAILQKKLGIDHDLILKELEEMREISVAFHYQSEQLQYLDSLLTAYDETIMKQRKIISHLYSSLEDSEKKTENLVKDNQFLLLELQEKTKQILQIYSKGFVDDNLVSSYNKLQRETQIQQIENMREENQYLLRHYRSQEAKASKLEQELTEIQRKSDFHYQNYKKQTDELKNAIIKVDDLLKIKEVLQKKFDEVTQENIELQSAREHLETKVNRLEADHKTIRNQLHQQRSKNREELEKITDELESLKIQSEASEKREREYFNKNMLLEKDVQSLRDDNRALKRETQKIKTDFEQTLKMCEAYEEKMRNYSRKQNIMNQTLEDSKEKLDTALLERDKAQLKEKQLQKLIQNINSRNRDEMETLKGTFEKIINQQNEKIKFLEEDKDDISSNFHQSQVSLKHQIDKLKRQNNLLKEQTQKNLQSVRNNSGNQIISRLKDLEQKNQALTRNISQKQRMYREDVDHKDELIRNLENENRDIARQVDRQRNSAREALNERTQLRSRISVIQKQKQCLQEEVSRLKRAIDTRATSHNEEKGLRIRQLEQKLRDAVLKQKDTREKAIVLLQKYDESQEQLKLEYEKKVNTLNAELTTLRRKLANR